MENSIVPPPEAPRSLVAKSGVPQTPMAMIAALLERNTITSEGVAAMGELVKLKERMEDRQSQRDFNVAFATLQAQMPPVKAMRAVENSASKGGGVRYMFAAFEDIMAQVKPHLDKHGFALSFSTDYTTTQPFRVIVKCTLVHAGGHEKSNTFAAKIGDGPPGCSGAQADGAAATYAKRFALCQALNIVVEGMDDDARATSSDKLSAEQTVELMQLYQSLLNQKLINDVDAFWKFCEAPQGKFHEIPANKYERVMQQLRKRIPT